MARKRLTAKADKRVRKQPAASTVSCSKKRVSFAAEVEYIEPPSSLASAAGSSDPAAVPAEPTAQELAVAEPGEEEDIEGDSSEGEEIAALPDVDYAAWKREHDEQEAARRATRLVQMHLQEAMHEYKMANQLDLEKDESWDSRGWRCYAFEIGCCEPELDWATPAKGGHALPFYHRCRCIEWHETLPLIRKRGRARHDLHPRSSRHDRRDRSTFAINVDFGVCRSDSGFHWPIEMHGCVRCGWCDGESKCSRSCRKRVEALESEPIYCDGERVR